jgi:hypothetical protein
MVKQAPKECINSSSGTDQRRNDPTAALGLRAVVAAHSMTFGAFHWLGAPGRWEFTYQCRQLFLWYRRGHSNRDHTADRPIGDAPGRHR